MPLSVLRAEIFDYKQAPRPADAWRRVIATVPGSAAACTRAAMLGVSPKTSASCAGAAANHHRARIDADPLTDSFACPGCSLSLAIASRIARPARAARSASLS